SMFRNLAKSVRKLLGTARESSPRRKPSAPRKSSSGRVRLEALETRELLTANFPRYNLVSGNLYNTPISPSPPGDAGIQRFAFLDNPSSACPSSMITQTDYASRAPVPTG